MKEEETKRLEDKIREAQLKKEKVVKELESRIGAADRYVVKILIAGLLISIMITISGALVFLLTQFIPELGWNLVFSLPLGLQIVLFGGALFVLFGLLALFNIIWKKGYYLLLRWFYSIAE
ncbi:MAG: hypothetical protein ACTSYO_01035 [Candidatus Ranarchaeia archaeon]